ncbi:MAG: PrsW family glutamic-type intramembrane protease [Bacteroidales bacterium]|nr:PrsW family glutamic-type intramembrane protease [Bacteroidales bacterium]
MNTIHLLSWFQAPLFALIFILILRSKFSINSWKYILRAFLFGMASVLFIFLLDLIAGAWGYDQLKNLKRSAFFSFVIIGFGSEFGKFLILRYIFLPLKSFKSPLDGVIYSIFISLGFATIALPLYTSGFFSREVEPLFIFTFPFANLLFSIIMGFFVGMGKMRKNRLIDSVTGLGSASFFHGFYFFTFLTSDKTILLVYGLGVFLIAVLLGAKSLNVKSREESNRE